MRRGFGDLRGMEKMGQRHVAQSHSSNQSVVAGHPIDVTACGHPLKRQALCGFGGRRADPLELPADGDCSATSSPMSRSPDTAAPQLPTWVRLR
jgi:hypothetical protein